jgi:hypothetical protein
MATPAPEPLAATMLAVAAAAIAAVSRKQQTTAG